MAPERKRIILTLDVPPDDSRSVEFTTLTWQGLADRVAFEKHFHQPVSVLLDETVEGRQPHVGTTFLLWRCVRRHVQEFAQTPFDDFAELLIDFDVQEVDAKVDPPVPAESLA